MGILDRIRDRFAGAGLILGEQSKLRQEDGDASSWGYTTLFGDYTLRTSHVDYELARQLYRNENDNYKLGAWPAKPVVNTIAGFMGAPTFSHKLGDEVIDGVLNEGINEWTSPFLQLNRNAARDGDVFARIEIRPNRFDRDDVDFQPRLIPPEYVQPPDFDPITGEMREIIIRYPVVERTRDGKRMRKNPTYYIVETITPTTRTLEIDGTAPRGAQDDLTRRMKEEEDDNAWGFIPIVHFKNDAEEQAVYGMSDLEPIEPFMRAYHDAFLFALQGAKSIARPKMAFNLADIDTFLKRNFTPDEIKSGRLRYMNKEMFMLQRDTNGAGADSVEFIVADTGLAGVASLLEFLFYCIVDVSQTPEFAFGTAVASSKASVSEQMPVLGRNIRRKRGELEDPFTEFASMYLAMQAQVGMAKPATYRTKIEWDEVNPKDDADVATTISNLFNAMAVALDADLISLDAAVETCREFVPSMLKFIDPQSPEDEKRRIIETAAFRQQLENQTADANAPEPPELRIRRLPGGRDIPAGAAL